MSSRGLISGIGFAGLALTVMAPPVRGENEPTVAALREAVLRANSVDKAAEAYKAYFVQIGRVALKDRMKDEDTGIALQSAWEVHLKPAKRKKSDDIRTDDIYDPDELGKFVAFLKDRTKAPVPEWWARCVVDVDLFPGRHHAFVNPRAHSEKPRAAETGDAAKVEEKDDDIVYSAGGRSVRFPKDTFKTLLPPALVGVLGEKRSVVAAYDPGFGGRFPLAGFAGAGGKPTWTAEVWGAGRTVLAGLTYHRVQATEQGDIVYLFGIESHGAYVEAFEAATGKCRFRFCTGYWFHFSEEWGLK